jgi:large subunit ribosomal protein L32e
MATEVKKLIRVRLARRARFSRQCLHAKVKLADTWRRPRGLHSKQRKDYRAKGAHPEAGFGSPKAVRGFHPSGYREVLVFTPDALEGIDPATTAVRIGGTVGGRKRDLIQDKAGKLGIRVLNRKEPKTAAVPVEEVKADE